MFKHLNPWYDLQEESAPGTTAHWDHHVSVKNPVHHDNMAAKHFALSDSHGKAAARSDENAQQSFSRASALTSNKPTASKMDQIRKHMERAAKHMMDCHDHACLEDYHQGMGEAHSEYRDHLSGRKGASEKRAHAHAERAAKVLD
jgi:hypothetical protein